MKKIILLLLMFVSLASFAQITNGNINYELRVDQWRQTCDNDGLSNDDNEVRIGLSSDANTGGSTSWTSGGDGASCSGNSYVKRWQADAPSTVTANNTLLYNCTNRANVSDAFTINYNSWEEDGSPDCDHSGDACNSSGTYAYTFKSTTKTPALWWGYSGTSNGSFMTGNSGDFFAKTVWRYTNGSSCAAPLLFGTLVSGTAKTHVNTNRAAPAGASSDKGYLNVLGNASPEVYYQFTISAASNVIISTANTGTNYDTYLRLYNSGCGSELAFNDDAVGVQSTINVNLCAGTYIVLVEGFGSNAGEFNLSVLATTVSFSGGSIGGITSGVSICTGSDPGAFTDAVSPSNGVPTLGYQWESSTTSASAGFSNIASANALTYDPAALTHTTWFRRRTTDGCGTSVYSNVIQVVVQNPSTTGLATGDFFWTGRSSDVWTNGANWLVYSGSAFSVATAAPAITDNVFIDALGSCVSSVSNTYTATGSAKNVTVRSGGQLVLGSGSTLNIGGAFYNNSGNVAHVSADAGSTVVFTSTASTPREIAGNTSTSFGILTQNNSGAVTVGTETTIKSTLNMNGGFVLNARLILGTSAASPGTLNHSASATNTMKGSSYFRRYFNAATNTGSSGVMPFGVTAGSYQRNVRLEFTTAPSSGGWVEGRFVASALSLATGLPILNDGGVNITNYMNEGYWELIPGGGLSGGTYTLTLGRDGIATVNNPSLLRIIKSPNLHTTWVANGSHGSVSASAISRTGMSGFSWFVIGSSAINPLPIELVSMGASCKSESVVLNWTTATESNSSHFMVERSENGTDWTTLDSLNAAGNSSSQQDYAFEDLAPVRGLAYYRLTQVDFSGETESFDAVSIYCVDFSKPNETVAIYPNPTSGSFTVEVNTEQGIGNCSLQIFDLMGRKVLEKSFTLNSGSNKVFIHEGEVSKGTYQILVALDGLKQSSYQLFVK